MPELYLSLWKYWEALPTLMAFVIVTAFFAVTLMIWAWLWNKTWRERHMAQFFIILTLASLPVFFMVMNTYTARRILAEEGDPLTRNIPRMPIREVRDILLKSAENLPRGVSGEARIDAMYDDLCRQYTLYAIRHGKVLSAKITSAVPTNSMVRELLSEIYRYRIHTVKVNELMTTPGIGDELHEEVCRTLARCQLEPRRKAFSAMSQRSATLYLLWLIAWATLISICALNDIRRIPPLR